MRLLGYLIVLLASIPVHESTHSLQSHVLGAGWTWPTYYPFTLQECPSGPNGFPALACTDVADGPSWTVEPLAYAIQAIFLIAGLIVVYKTNRTSPTIRAGHLET
jgi:hypothetical protein